MAPDSHGPDAAQPRRSDRPAPAALGGRPNAARAREVLEGRMAGPPTLERLAAELDTSPFALLRAFREAYGMPPHTWLTDARVRRARQLLDTGVPPAEAAVVVGFTDQSHLNRHFTRSVGVPPGAYQRARGGENPRGPADPAGPADPVARRALSTRLTWCKNVQDPGGPAAVASPVWQNRQHPRDTRRRPGQARRRRRPRRPRRRRRRRALRLRLRRDLGGLRTQPPPDLCPQPARLHRRLAVRPRRRARRGRQPFTAAAGAFFLGTRNAFYGLRLSQLLALPKAVRPSPRTG